MLNYRGFLVRSTSLYYGQTRQPVSAASRNSIMVGVALLSWATICYSEVGVILLAFLRSAFYHIMHISLLQITLRSFST